MLPALLFDLDGTLVDSAPDLIAATRHALAQVGLAQVGVILDDDAQLRRCAGQGAVAMLTHGLALAGAAQCYQAAALLPLFLDYYRAHIADHSRVFDGLMPVLDAAVQEERPLAIVTNKPAQSAAALIAALALESRFPVIVGGDRVQKPSPEPIREAMAALRVDQAVMIGDSRADCQAAATAAVPFIGVGYGYGSRELEAEALRWFARRPQDLQQEIDSLSN